MYDAAPRPSFHVTTKGTWIDHLTHSHYASKPMLLLALLCLGAGGTIYFTLKNRVWKGTEPTTAGLNYIVGPMGSGKSMFGVGRIIAALVAGQYAVTNVRLRDGWAEQLVSHSWPRCRGQAYADRVRHVQGHYVYESALRVAMRYRVPCFFCGGDVRSCGHSGPQQENRAVFVWDESHNDLNNRDYQGHGVDRNEREMEKERRRLVVRWATQLRKLGFSGYLLSQHHENTDAQLRRVCNHIVRLQNQRNAENSVLAKMLPRRWTLFLVYWYPAHLATGISEHMIKPVRQERYWLPWYRTLYDSWETFAGIDEHDGEDAPILLPAGGRYSDQGGTLAAAEAPRPRRGVAALPTLPTSPPQ